MAQKQTVSARLRVVLAIGSLDVGGAEKQIVALAEALAKMNVDVTMMLLVHRGDRIQRLQANGVRVVTLLADSNKRAGLASSASATLKGLWRAFAFFRAHRPDVLHAWMFHSYFALIPLAWVAGVPVRIQGRRGMRAARLRLSWLSSLSFLVRPITTAVTVNSRAMRDEVVSQDHFASSRVFLIPNSVEIPNRLAQAGSGADTGVLVARFVHAKAHDVLLRALASIDDPPHLVLVGGGPLLPTIQTMAAELGVSEYVDFVGECEDASAYQESAQFAVLCSRTEGLPNAILEAMSLGLPTVATDVGGVRELVSPEETGLLVPSEDVAALAAALSRAAHDREWRVRAGARARERAQQWDIDRVAQAYVSLYLTLKEATRHTTKGDLL